MFTGLDDIDHAIWPY